MNCSKNSNGIMLFYIYLIVAIGFIHCKDVAVTDTLNRCCDHGKTWAQEDLQCSTFPAPVAGVPVEQQSICLSLVEMCCVRTHRESQCKAGQNAAKLGKECTPSSNKPGVENFKDCCEACKMGIIIGSSAGSCDPKAFGPPWDQSFMECCKEVLPTTTTTTTPATTEITSTTSTTTTTPSTLKNKNKIAPPPPPTLESLCDALVDQLCAHICVPIPGSYRCECRKGFALMDDKKSCQQIDVSDRCKINNPCEQQCIDTGVAVRCSCDRGYKLNPDKKTCRDIDECEEKIDMCGANEVCVNEPGTYTCLDEEDTFDPDYDKERCPEGYTYNFYSNLCDDLDECTLGMDNCGEKNCKNTIGSYICSDSTNTNGNKVKCPPGYYYKMAIESCADIDECATGADDCNRESQICLNTQGGYTCQNRASRTTCPAGFKINSIGLCGDIDECTENLEICSEVETCINEMGGYRCVSATSSIKPTSEETPISEALLKSTTPKDISSEFPQSPSPTYSSPVSPTQVTNDGTPTTKETSEQSENTSPEERYSTTSKPEIQTQTTFQYTTTTAKPFYGPISPPIYQPPIRTPPYYHPDYPHHNFVPYPKVNQTACTPGLTYSPSYGRCVDIDECLEDNHACDSNQECRNTYGSYICTCKPGYQLDTLLSACVDINECQTGEHDCLQSQRCDNTIGSFQCVRVTSCGTGYTLNAATGLCEDDDECALGTDNCKILGSLFKCRNTLGSFRCERKRCLTNNCQEHRTVYNITSFIYTNPSNNNHRLTSIKLKKCLPGYLMNSNGRCDDINECESSPCAKNQQCLNTNGSFRCLNLISCMSGMKLSSDGTHCEDIDECETGTHSCTGGQQCINREGYHICQCPPGHKTNENNQCEDINECEYLRGHQICAHNAECENTIGSYRCRCKDGFREVNNGKSCEDINECIETANLCHHTCVNVWGGYRCACKRGYTLNVDNRTCNDIDECEKFKDRQLCVGICQNTPGSYICRCPEGYRLGVDGRTCQDIDECQRGNICPSPNDICWNIRGSYRCNSIQCPHNYIRDPEQKNRCKRASDYCRDTACMRQPSSYSYNFITFVSKLPLPTEGYLDLFTMRGPRWDTTTVMFNMEFVNVRCPHGIQKADSSYFRMRRSSTNQAVLSLTKVMEGPQDAELQLIMEVFQNGEYKGSVVAKLFIVVSEYEF